MMQWIDDPRSQYGCRLVCNGTDTGDGTVDGACGTSNDGSFTSAPTMNLCSVGVASAVSGTGPFTWTCAGTNGGSSASCSANLSSPGTCDPGEGFGGEDVEWIPLTVLMSFPTEATQASGDSGRAIRFIADDVHYPNGVTMQVFDQSAQPLPKDVVISSCPHDFIATANCTQQAVGSTATFELRFGPATKSYDCPLTPGGTYYINFRDANVPRGTVQTQFNNLKRGGG